MPIPTGSVPQGYIFKSVPRSIAEKAAQSPAGKPGDITKSAIRNFIKTSFDQEPFKSLLHSFVPASIEYTTAIVPSGRRRRRLYVAELIREYRTKLPVCLVASSEPTPIVYLDPIHNGYFYEGKMVYQLHTHERTPITITYAHEDSSSCEELRTCLSQIFTTIADLTRTKVLKGTSESSQWEVRIPKMISPGAVERQSMGDDPVDDYYMGSFSMEVEFEAVFYACLGKARLDMNQSSAQFTRFVTYSAPDLPTSLSLENPAQLLDIPHIPERLTVKSSNPSVLEVFLLEPTVIQVVVKEAGTANIIFKDKRNSTVEYEHEVNVVVMV